MPRPISEWGLSSSARKKVAKELCAWLDLFIKQANGEQGNVYRADFINNNFFYFTNCQDLHPEESKAIEQDRKIRNRKEKVMLQLFLKTLLGVFVPLKAICSHCGKDNMVIDAISNGHFYFCPNCGKMDVSTYYTDKDALIKAANEVNLKFGVKL